MNEDINRNSRVSYAQLEALLNFMESHRDLAVGFLRTTEARHKSQELWSQIASNLNSQGGGAHKTVKGWTKYWSDYKNKLKVRLRALNKSHTGTGGGGALCPPLSAVEERAVGILGPRFGGQIPNVRVDPLPPLLLNAEGDYMVLPFAEDAPPPPATTATVTSGSNIATTSHSAMSDITPDVPVPTTPIIIYGTENEDCSTPAKKPKKNRQRSSTPRGALADAKADVLEMQKEQIKSEKATASAIKMMAEALNRQSDIQEKMINIAEEGLNRQAYVNERLINIAEEGLEIWKKALEKDNKTNDT